MGLPRPIATAIAAIVLCLAWTSAAGAQTPGRRRLPEGHARRQHAEPDGARRRPGRSRLLHRARRAADDLEAEHAADRDRGHASRSRRSQENGLLGLQLAPDFATSNWVYLFYSQLPDSSNTQVDRALQGQRRHARPRLGAAHPDLPAPARRSAATRPGSLYFGPDGSLYISTGDNTNPFDSDGFNPIDERPGRELLGRAAHRGQHERPQRQDPARSSRCDEPDRRARRRHDVHDPGRQPLPRPTTRRTRPGRRSSAWASATRSASRSTRRRAGS